MAEDSCKTLQNKCHSIYVNRFYISWSWFYQSRKRKNFKSRDVTEEPDVTEEF
jgi:hypothetical protein